MKVPTLTTRSMKLTPEQLKAHQAVFGHDVTFDAEGKPVEAGRGSEFNQTSQHLSALSKTQEIEDTRISQVELNRALLKQIQKGA